MGKKTQKLKPDTVLKNYWNNNEKFADLFNAVLFGGRQVIRPEELENVDTEESHVLEHRKYAESIQASRDNIKIRKRSGVHGVELAMLAAEHQEYIHYAMPMRVMGYDYAAYKKQYDSNAAKYSTKKGLDDHEFLSKMRRTDKFIPVITIVVYYGEKEWDGALTLHEMLGIDREFSQYVNDYRMLLVEAGRDRLPFYNADNIDLFHLLAIFQDDGISKSEAKRKAIEYSEEHHTSRSVVMAVAGAVNAGIDYDALEKGEKPMYTLFEELAKESETRGRAMGIVEFGCEVRLSEQDILEQLQKKLKITLPKAREYFNMYRK